MVMAASTHLKMDPKRMSLPMRTSTGNAARWKPKGVSSSSGSRAPTPRRRSTAEDTDVNSGGSISHDSTADNDEP